MTLFSLVSIQIWDGRLAREARIQLRLSCKYPDVSFFAINPNDTCSNLVPESSGDLSSDIQTWYNELSGNFYPPEPPFMDHGTCWPPENCSHAVVVSMSTFSYYGLRLKYIKKVFHLFQFSWNIPKYRDLISLSVPFVC